MRGPRPRPAADLGLWLNMPACGLELSGSACCLLLLHAPAWGFFCLFEGLLETLKTGKISCCSFMGVGGLLLPGSPAPVCQRRGRQPAAPAAAPAGHLASYSEATVRKLVSHDVLSAVHSLVDSQQQVRPEQALKPS